MEGKPENENEPKLEEEPKPEEKPEEEEKMEGTFRERLIQSLQEFKEDIHNRHLSKEDMFREVNEIDEIRRVLNLSGSYGCCCAGIPKFSVPTQPQSSF
ncbi:hypothetical protein MC885_021576 [Smutsia gigantea]|nr:hypothetical protein MC885_021576 [Smutsia gigantea]